MYVSAIEYGQAELFSLAIKERMFAFLFVEGSTARASMTL